MSVQQIPSVNKLTTNNYQSNGWTYTFQKSIISSSKEIECMQYEANLQQIPDVVFGNNICKLTFDNGFKISFNAIDSLRYCNYEYLHSNYHDYKNGMTNNNKSINVIPGEIQIKYAEAWKQKDLTDIDVKVLEKISDTFYSTPYKGTISQVKVEETDININIGNLTEKNPILFSDQITIWEDELGDNGLVSLDFKHIFYIFRFRVMKDCFFGLLRNYTRVDDVIVRIYDTRLYHEFKDNFMIREFSVRENSYQELLAKGFIFSTEFTSEGSSQSFKIYNQLDVKLIIKEKIIFK